MKVEGVAKVRHNGTIAFNSTARRYLYYKGIVCDESYLCVEYVKDDGVIIGHFSDRKENGMCRRVICAGFDWLYYISKRIIRLWNKKFGVHPYRSIYKVRYEIWDSDNVVYVKMVPKIEEVKEHA